MKKTKHYLYVIGGPARVGKSTVADKVMRQKNLIMLSTDALRSAVDSIFLDQSPISLENIGMQKKFSFNGAITFQKSNTSKTSKLIFKRTNQDRDDLAWLAAVGLINAYDRSDNIDVLVEGNAVTPERVHQLKLKNLIVRAAFIGYNDESHLASILAYSKQNKDWIYKWIQEHKGDDAHIKQRAQGKIKKSIVIKKLAKKFGYGYFDVAKEPFRKHIDAVTSYLLR
jgi:2-phosphoglycerate kinase